MPCVWLAISRLIQSDVADLEELLRKVELPTTDMELPLEQYIDIICSILDIPVHKSRVQALHVLFTLYSEFKNSQHFKALADDNLLNNEQKKIADTNETDRLEL